MKRREKAGGGGMDGAGGTTSAGSDGTKPGFDAEGNEIKDEFSHLDETSLEFPWMISELAIMGNQQVW